MSKSINKITFFIFLSFIFLASIYRILGITINHPFWVDEFSSANQARLLLDKGLGVFNNPNIVFDAYNVGYHTIIALFFNLFGESEFVARLPSVIIGSIIPALVFLVGYRLFNRTTGVIAGLLSTTSYFLITWSRQARAYAFAQFFILITLLLYLEITERKTKSPLLFTLLIIFIACGLLIHPLYSLFIVSLGIHFFIINRNKIKTWIRNPLFYVITIFLGCALYLSNFLSILLGADSGEGLIKANNIWYYHSFLWREHMLITYLFILGIFFLMLENRRKFLLIFIYICLHLIFILFLFSPYISRYLLPVWPFILLLCGYALFNIASQLSKKTSIPTVMIGIFLTLIIIINGHKFVFKPKSFYSVNHDFREIALIDYNSIYSIIKQKGHLDDGKTAVIDTWHDRIYWYLGSHYSATYLFRWQNDKDTTNGLLRKTFFVYNNNGEKILPRQKDLRFIGELKDLKIAMQKYARGFIFIDDNTMPKDVIHYVETHFKKELYLDHYPSDDNPYSIWPATLYSWGI